VKSPDGEDERVHVVPAKFNPEAVTAVPEEPWVGLKVSVVAVTVKVAVAEESLATFVVADTVYVPEEPDATVKLPVNVPDEIEHVGELRRPDGVDTRALHVLPA
jgi:hypothetical protein